jgi:hypothetical protein
MVAPINTLSQNACGSDLVSSKPRLQRATAEREWWWLNGALHASPQVNIGDPGAYWRMLTQKRAVDRKRVEIASRIAGIVRSI